MSKKYNLVRYKLVTDPETEKRIHDTDPVEKLNGFTRDVDQNHFGTDLDPEDKMNLTQGIRIHISGIHKIHKTCH